MEYYWSSSEYVDGYLGYGAWNLDFATGGQNGDRKYFMNHVRAIRAF
jgi:hypothetical protein